MVNIKAFCRLTQNQYHFLSTQECEIFNEEPILFKEKLMIYRFMLVV